MGAAPNRAVAGLLAALLFLAGVTWPLRDAVWTGAIPGAGPDVISTTWGAWWLHAVGWSGLTGGWTELANAPTGALGTILSPLTTGLQAALMGAVGVGRAATITVALHALAHAGATGWMARQAGLGRDVALVAACALFVGRYLLFGVGEGSIVAVAALPVPLGIGALARVARGTGGLGWGTVAAACAGWAALENPYLAPVVPGVALVLAASVRPRARHLLAAGALGALAVGGVVALFKGGASPDYPREVAGTVLSLGSWSFTVVDQPWARVNPLELIWGGPVRWTEASDDAVRAAGGRTLGWTVLGLAAWGLVRAPRAALPWLGLAGVSALLAAGSMQAGVGLPFLYLNTILADVARPLTQPVRFVAVVQLGLVVAAGVGASALRAHRWGLSAVLAAFLVESLVVGSGALRLPTTPLPAAPCMAELGPDVVTPAHPDGAVLTWPWDARDGEHGRSQLLQMRHGRPGAHRGIASWARPGADVLVDLRSAGWRDAGPARPRLETLRIRMLGYRWVVAEPAADPAGVAWLRGELGAPVLECGAVAVFSLGR